MPRAPETKTVAAVREHDDDQSGNYLAAAAANHDTQNTPESWEAKATSMLARRADSGNPFTATDLRIDGVPEPAKPSQWGNLFRSAQAEGLIVSVGVVNSRRASRHGSLMRVWVGAHGKGIAA